MSMLSPTTDSASPSDGHRKVLVSLSNHQTLKFKANSFSLEGLQAKIEGLQSYGKFCETRVKRLETQRKQQQSKAKPRTNEACNSPFKIEGQALGTQTSPQLEKKEHFADAQTSPLKSVDNDELDANDEHDIDSSSLHDGTYKCRGGKLHKVDEDKDTSAVLFISVALSSILMVGLLGALYVRGPSKR